MVSQCTLNRAEGDRLVTTTGPPALPAGSRVPDICISRFGMGRAHHRAVVAVAEGEGVGQGVVEGKVGPWCSSPW